MASAGTGEAKARAAQPRSKPPREGHPGCPRSALGDRSVRLWGPLVQVHRFLQSRWLASERGGGSLPVSHAPANAGGKGPIPVGSAEWAMLCHPTGWATAPAHHRSQPKAPSGPQTSWPGATPRPELSRRRPNPLSWSVKGSAKSGERASKQSSPLHTGR